MLKLVNAVSHLDYQKRQWRDERATLCINEFVQTKTRDIVRDVVSRVQALTHWAGKLVAKPVLRVPGLELDWCDVFSEANRVAFSTARTLSSADKAGCNWGAALDNYWAARHRPVFEGDWVGPTCGAEESECHRHGFCICCPSGRRVQGFRNSVLTAIKELAPRKTRMRDLVVDGFIVMRLKGTPVDSVFAGLDDPELEDEDSIVAWWHLSELILSPHTPVVQVMDFARDGDRHRPLGNRCVTLEAAQGGRAEVDATETRNNGKGGLARTREGQLERGADRPTRSQAPCEFL
eukprot:6761914-Pyramimonas_sp.AAC.1